MSSSRSTVVSLSAAKEAISARSTIVILSAAKEAISAVIPPAPPTSSGASGTGAQYYYRSTYVT
jgi:hypothetical protein